MKFINQMFYHINNHEFTNDIHSICYQNLFMTLRIWLSFYFKLGEQSQKQKTITYKLILRFGGSFNIKMLC